MPIGGDTTINYKNIFCLIQSFNCSIAQKPGEAGILISRYLYASVFPAR